MYDIIYKIRLLHFYDMLHDIIQLSMISYMISYGVKWITHNNVIYDIIHDIIHDIIWNMHFPDLMCPAAADPPPAQRADETNDDLEPDRPMDLDEERDYAD